MGLDMYLTGKQYVSKYDHNPKDVQLQMMLKTVLKKWNMGNDKKQIDYPVQYIEFSLMQWRKSNQIHEWFVQTVQKGKDDCGSYYVGEDDCKELLKICKIVLENKGNDKKILELLPLSLDAFSVRLIWMSIILRTLRKLRKHCRTFLTRIYTQN